MLWFLKSWERDGSFLRTRDCEVEHQHMAQRPVVLVKDDKAYHDTGRCERRKCAACQCDGSDGRVVCHVPRISRSSAVVVVLVCIQHR